MAVLVFPQQLKKQSTESSRAPYINFVPGFFARPTIALLKKVEILLLHVTFFLDRHLHMNAPSDRIG